MAEQTLDQQATQMPITIDKRALAEDYLRHACVDSLRKIEGAIRGANAQLDGYYATGGDGWSREEIFPAKHFHRYRHTTGEVTWEAHIDEHVGDDDVHRGYRVEVFHTDPVGTRLDTIYWAGKLKSIEEAKSIVKSFVEVRFGK